MYKRVISISDQDDHIVMNLDTGVVLSLRQKKTICMEKQLSPTSTFPKRRLQVII